MNVNETQHELPCGHVLSTALLLDHVDGFASPNGWGTGDCPHCGTRWSVAFARMEGSDGSTERMDTYLSTGQVEGGPGTYFVPHQRRRVPGLVVDGSVARLGGREWRLGTR
jgi:hypothetical protein